VKFGFVAKHRGAWPVNLMCEALGVSRGGFYAWLARPRSRRSLDDEKLGAQVHQSFVRSDRTYGARRVWRDVLEQGQPCGLHRIERLMREQALRARPRRRGLPKDRGERSVVADNVLDRQFQADAPNQKWVADFTYIWTAEGWLYVAAVLDLYSRRIVGWSMQESMTSQLVVDALMMAVWRRGKPVALLHHSDQGSQYTSSHFQQLLREQGITCSMSRAGEVWDNSAMESFFSSMKTERTARKVYRSREQARADVFDYIERFYNPMRRHSTLGYVSPVQFEQAQKSLGWCQPNRQQPRSPALSAACPGLQAGRSSGSPEQRSKRPNRAACLAGWLNFNIAAPRRRTFGRSLPQLVLANRRAGFAHPIARIASSLGMSSGLTK